ncbi:uncharacterized protein LOC116849629 [Odontomachus brunneus]|uniref:uncharacterized protein LOC116849629 n=1 Tax=Odontomachus brunneus TaxID=486640 RepID=UPI0013F1CB5A|nr:uncharacterized protein LOC116849629 [Odontomachus brunneus]
MHRPQHMQICEYINRFLRENEIRRDCALSLTNWITLRQQFLSSIKKWIPRKLKPYEEQMILFAKSCSICHRQINLEHCKRCYSDNYCRDHRPLTFYYGMKIAGLYPLHPFQQNKYVMHMIALNTLEREYLNAWEILLHLLQHIRKLTIVLVGPNFKQDHYDIELCSFCKNGRSHLQPLHSAKNSFRSWRPWRDLETGSVYFRNVTVYRNTIVLWRPY